MSLPGPRGLSSAALAAVLCLACGEGDPIGPPHSPAVLAQASLSGPDVTPPVLHMPDDVVVEAEEDLAAWVVLPQPTAVDDVDGIVPGYCGSPQPTLFPLGTTIVTCFAYDNSGNQATADLRVHVVDTTPPTLYLPGNMELVPEDAAGVVVSFSATAIDRTWGAASTACVPPSGSLFPPGITVVTCTAVDGSHNEATGSFTVTVLTASDILQRLVSTLSGEAAGPGPLQLAGRALASLDAENHQAACAQLAALHRVLGAGTGGEEAETILLQEEVSRIMRVAGC